MTILETIIQDAKLVPKTIWYKFKHGMELTEQELKEYFYWFNTNNPGANMAKLENVVLSNSGLTKISRF